MSTEPRVFWPGDDLPVGIWVMSSDERPSQTWAPGKVDPHQPVPLVEVPIPDYQAVVKAAAERDGVEMGVHERSGRWGVLGRKESQR